MNKWWLVTCFFLLISLALPAAFYPLRKSKKVAYLLMPLMIFAAALAYWHWGAMGEWQRFLNRQENQKKIQAVFQTIKSPTQIIERLKARLQEQPNSARGWYLLGRLYASQEQWTQARDAFIKAHQLNADDEATTINYAQSLWQLNHQQFNEPVRKIFKEVLQKNPNQPDALAMLAMDAYMAHNYQLAIDYWQQLLKLAPQQSQEAQMIRKAIAKAQSELPS